MKFLKYFLLIAFLLISNKAYCEVIKFVQVTDIHYSPAGLTDSGRDISSAGIALNKIIKNINDSDAQFVVFLGDSIDKSNIESLNSFLEIVKQLKKPYYVVIGNHDAHKVSGISKEAYMETVHKYNPNQPVKKLSFTFDINKDFKGIIMDGTATSVPSAHGHFNAEKLNWLDKTLTKNQNKKVIIFQHYPIEEPTDNRSHNILNKEDYQSVLDKHKNVVAISSGHYHTKQVKTDARNIVHISTPAAYEPPFKYDYVEVGYQKLPFGDLKKVEVFVTTKQCTE